MGWPGGGRRWRDQGRRLCGGRSSNQGVGRIALPRQSSRGCALVSTSWDGDSPAVPGRTNFIRCWEHLAPRSAGLPRLESKPQPNPQWGRCASRKGHRAGSRHDRLASTDREDAHILLRDLAIFHSKNAWTAGLRESPASIKSASGGCWRVFLAPLFNPADKPILASEASGSGRVSRAY